MSSFTVLYDANVLYPSLLRDLLIRIAQTGMVQAKWTDQILDETFDNLKQNRPDIPSEKFDRTRTLMNRAVRDCLVEDYEPLVSCLTLPDENDRHVLAAAIKAGAQIIVTSNIRDFPAESLRPWQVEAMQPDDFVRDLIDLDRATVLRLISTISHSYQAPPLTTDDILDRLAAGSPPLISSAAALRAQ